MRGPGIREKRRCRWLAGLFCASLLFVEAMSAGFVVSAQEPVPEVQGFAPQEKGEGKQEPGGEEKPDGAGPEEDDGQKPDGGETGEDGGQKPDGAGPEEDGGQKPDGAGTEEDDGQKPDNEGTGEDSGQKPDGAGPEEDGEQKPDGAGTGEDDGQKPDGAGAEEDDGQEPDDGEEPKEEDIPGGEDGETSVSENALGEEDLLLLAAEDDIANGNYGKVTWVIRADGELIVEGTGDFAPSASKAEGVDKRAPWYAYRENIKSATVRLTGATDLSGMFAGCDRMTAVELSGLKTDAVTNMSAMFASCIELRQLDLSGFDTSRVTDMSRMFAETYYAFRQLDLSSFDTSQVTDMSGMFRSCTGMSELDLSGFDTSQVTDMHEMFLDCMNLRKLDLSSFDTSCVMNMSCMFAGCTGSWDNAIELDVSGFDTSNVADMSRMFDGCYLLELDVSGFDTSNVADMHEMFSYTWNLTELDVSGFDTSHVMDMSGMFFQSAVQELDVSGFDTSHVTNMSCLFKSCEALRQLDVSGFDTSHVMDMSEMFSYCGALKQLDVSGFDTSQVTDMNNMFSQCEALGALDVSGFDTSKVTGMASMFAGCKNLAKLDLRHFDTGCVTSIASMFQNCENLTELDLSNFDTSKLSSTYFGSGSYLSSSISRMFSGCKRLERLDVSGFGTARVAVMPEMFDGCESLRELDLSSFTMAGVTKEAYCASFLRGCKKLEKFYSPHFVKVKLELPKEKDSDVWRGVIDGNMIETTDVAAVANGRYENIQFVRNQEQIQAEERIEAKKRKTIYDCGDTLSISDLRVNYFDAAGGIDDLVPVELSSDGVHGYTTNMAEIDMSTPGEKTLVITFVTEAGKELTDTVKLQVTQKLTAANTTIALPQDFDFVYTGKPVQPVPTVTLTQNGQSVALAEGVDYSVSYRNHINACPVLGAGGQEPTVMITGMGSYGGKLTVPFAISKAAAPEAEELLCYAADCGEAAAGRTIDLSGTFAGCERKMGYHIVSVTEDDAIAGTVLARMPADADISRSGTLTYSTNAGEADDFAVVKMLVFFPNYADAELTVKIVLSEEKIAYTVTYDTLGHGGSGWTVRARAGSLIGEPEPLTESGYLFAGWYADRQLARKWDFTSDTVQEDITLYAGWLSDRSEGRLQMYIQDIEDLAYTGKALKPTVVVYDGDGETLLKAGKDYTVKYYNNTNAGGAESAGAVARAVNPGKKNETLTDIAPGTGGVGANHHFTKEAPYIAITGKGNYTETVYKNFRILPADIGTADAAPAQGFTLKYSDQLVTNGKKEQKPFSSMKYKKAMKAGVDFRLSLEAADASDAAGHALVGWKAEGSDANKQNPAIPKGYSGTFRLTIEGQGNYAGKIRRTVFVDSKEKLIKNASITLARDQKSRPYTGQAVTQQDFSVKMGKTELFNGQDYTVSYADNVAVGTAVMTITGTGGYVGTKSVTFKITGEKFSAGNINVKTYNQEQPDDNDFKSSMPYTGSAVVQNKVTLSTKVTRANPNSKQLVYGMHYTVGYKNNVKKGTATMIFTAKPESGYSGSFKKTFKITAQTLSRERLTLQGAAGEGGGSPIQAVYCKNGAVPSFILKNEAGVTLKQGTDYTVKCKNNAAVTTAQTPENKKPVMTITGKGSYTGKIEVPFQVVQESIDRAVTEGIVRVSCVPVMKKEGMEFKNLKWKLVEGKKTLALGAAKDYTLDTADCTPDKMMAYAQALDAGTASGQPEPSVTIIGAGNYTGTKRVELGEYLYACKLENRSLYVVVHEGEGQNVYTGKQLTPQAEIYYGEAKAVSEAKKAKEKDGAVLTAAGYNLIRLTEKDYTLDYGANITAGKNKGSIKVTGAGKYGGSVTVKFNIERKPVTKLLGKEHIF